MDDDTARGGLLLGALVLGPLPPPAAPRGRGASVVAHPADELAGDGVELVDVQRGAAGVVAGDLHRLHVVVARLPVSRNHGRRGTGGTPR
ncbi:hypothetical protein, partial [Streptomyces chryseus]|uniref:hypothetical protein n=1 Tax=Streptomyces chryseus TaxID=68186 RepID=UPI001ABF00ED